MNPTNPTDRSPNRNQRRPSDDSPVAHKPGRYIDRQDAANRAYRAEWRALSSEQRKSLAAAGINGPVFHETGLESKPHTAPGAKLPRLTCPPRRSDGGFPIFNGTFEDDHKRGPVSKSKPKPELADYDPDPLLFQEDIEREKWLEKQLEDCDALLPTVEDGLLPDIHRILFGLSPVVSNRALGAKWGVSSAAVSKSITKLVLQCWREGIRVQWPTARGSEFRGRCSAGKLRYHREKKRNAAVAKGGAA